ncbi:MAG: class I SAM-dependent rRNA methyltransferase [Anaerolineae bacterium]|nr:class I SAM-dependent rRNA methyltransferase [Anaerolineae bacterium]
MIAVLHHSRLKTVSRRHPWIFSRAIRRFSDTPHSGDVVTLVDEQERFLARGLWSTQSEIRLRVLTWDDEPIDETFWRGRIQQALDLRGPVPPGQARRLINAENDYLPGLVVDQYGEWLVLQALTAGMEAHKDMLSAILGDMLRPRGIYERSDVDIRRREGLKDATGVLWGEAPPPLVEIQENGLRFWVDLLHGHKTGFYLDQRENRALLGRMVRPGARVLNAFAYSGGFGIYAYAAGAQEVISVDASQSALELAERNLALNGVEDAPLLVGDVFTLLRDLRDDGERFDVIVLDPPKFAKSKTQVESALRGYKDINLTALSLIKPGGLLLTFSCSGLVSTDLFRKVVFGALEDSGREAQVLRELGAPEDHPVALTFPEGAYLKGLLCRVLD